MDGTLSRLIFPCNLIIFLEAKLKLIFAPNYERLDLDVAMTIVEEVAPRIYHIECSSSLLVKAPRLNLKKCVFNAISGIGEIYL